MVSGDQFQKHDVLLDVHLVPVSVPRAAIEIVETRPPHWTVVPRPRQATRLPESGGAAYGVCPNCGNRSSLQNAPQTMSCQQCEGVFTVAWKEKYLGRT
jgi:hypothetical protein